MEVYKVITQFQVEIKLMKFEIYFWSTSGVEMSFGEVAEFICHLFKQFSCKFFSN